MNRVDNRRCVLLYGGKALLLFTISKCLHSDSSLVPLRRSFVNRCSYTNDYSVYYITSSFIWNCFYLYYHFTYFIDRSLRLGSLFVASSRSERTGPLPECSRHEIFVEVGKGKMHV